MNQSIIEKISDLESQISQMHERLNSHERKFGRLYEIMYQVFGRIYNQITEIDYIYNYWNYMVYNAHSDDHLENREVLESDSDIDTDIEDDADSV